MLYVMVNVLVLQARCYQTVELEYLPYGEITDKNKVISLISSYSQMIYYPIAFYF